MWCRQCHQEVAGVPSNTKGSLSCAKCGERFDLPSKASPSHKRRWTLAQVAGEAARGPRRSVSHGESQRELPGGDFAQIANDLQEIASEARAMNSALNHSMMAQEQPRQNPANSGRPANHTKARENETAPQPTGSADRFDPRTSLAALDRELQVVEDILSTWQSEVADPPTADTETDTPPSFKNKNAVVSPTHTTALEPKRPDANDTAISGDQHLVTQTVRAVVEKLQVTERQVVVLLLANSAFFVAAALAGMWTLLGHGSGLLAHVIGVGITAQICTLFCLTWLLSQLRVAGEQLSETEVMRTPKRKPANPVGSPNHSTRRSMMRVD